MSPAPRVLLVARRFWPLASDSSLRVLSLAAAWRQAGWRPTVLTAQWHSAWPESVFLRDVPVKRIGPAPTTPFRMRRYVRAISDWIARHRSDFDWLYFDCPEDEAAHVLHAQPSDSRPPLVCRFAPNELAAHWSSEMRFSKSLAVCRQADAVIVPRHSAQQRLVLGDISAAKIVCLPDCAWDHVSRQLDERTAARHALADINYELYLRGTDRLVLCPCELTRASGAELLVRAIGPVIEEVRGLRVWIIGDGHARERLGELLRRSGWRGAVVMPGTFEDLELLLQAADLCVLPTIGEGLGWILPHALDAGLPTLVCDGPDVGSMLSHDSRPLLFKNGETGELRDRIANWIDEPRTIDAAARTAATCLAPSNSVLQGWLELSRRLASNRIASPGVLIDNR